MVRMNSIAFHKSKAKAVIRRIVVTDSRRKNIKNIPGGISSSDSLETSYSNSLSIEAKDMEIDVGEYILDININKLKTISNRYGFKDISFESNIGDRINTPNEGIIILSKKSEFKHRNSIKSELIEVVKEGNHSPHLGLDPFSQEYESIDNLIVNIEKLSEQSTKSHNISNLNNAMNMYMSILYGLDETDSRLGTFLADEKITRPLLNSLFRIVCFSIDDINEYECILSDGKIHRIPVAVIIEHIYEMALKAKKGSIQNPSYSKFIELLEKCEKVASKQSPILADFIRDKIDELENYEAQKTTNEK